MVLGQDHSRRWPLGNGRRDHPSRHGRIYPKGMRRPPERLPLRRARAAVAYTGSFVPSWFIRQWGLPVWPVIPAIGHVALMLLSELGDSGMSVKVIVVDDDPDYRWLNAFALRTDPNISVVGETDDGEAALALVREEHPDVAVVDVMMPRVNGLELTRRIKRERPETKVVIVTSFVEDAHRRAAYASGADDVLSKGEGFEMLVPAVLAVTGGADRVKH
jgi:CheY-like chemotaxis protein